VRKHQIIYLLFTFTLVVTIGFYKFLDKVPTVPCENWGFMSIKTTKSYIHPEKVIVKPWLGRHHIYAIFMLPKGNLHDNFITVNLATNQTFCSNISKIGQNVDGIIAQPGYDLAKGYLHTRTGIKFILAGKINDIKKVENWRLGVASSLSKIN